MIVIDASVLAPALGDDDADGDAARARLRGEDLAAPEIIDLEVASVSRRTLADERRVFLALADLAQPGLREPTLLDRHTDCAAARRAGAAAPLSALPSTSVNQRPKRCGSLCHRPASRSVPHCSCLKRVGCPVPTPAPKHVFGGAAGLRAVPDTGGRVVARSAWRDASVVTDRGEECVDDDRRPATWH